MEEVLKRVRNGEAVIILAKEYKIALRRIYKQMEENGILKPKVVIDLIKEGKSNEQIKEMSKWTIEGINKQREKLRIEEQNREQRRRQEQKSNRKTMQDFIGKSEERKIRNLVATGIEVLEIADQLECSSATIKNMKFYLGMYNKMQIINLMNSYSDDEISEMTQVDKQVIAGIRREKGEKREGKIRRGDWITQQTIGEIRRLCAIGATTEEMQLHFGCDKAVINFQREKWGIYSQRQILGLLERKDVEEVSKIVQIDATIIEESIQAKIQEEQEFRILLARETSYEQIAKQLGYKSERAIFYRKNSLGALTGVEIIELLQSGVSIDKVAEMARVPQDIIEGIQEEKGKKQSERKVRKTLKELREINQKLSRTGKVHQKRKNAIISRCEALMDNHKEILSEADYSFIIYLYIKIGMQKTAIKMAKEYLNVEAESLEEVRTKIYEVLGIKNRINSTIVMLQPDVIMGVREETDNSR